MSDAVTLTVTVQEAQALIALCDIACKAAGLQCAEAAFTIARKAEAAMQHAQQTAAEPAE